MAPELRAPWLLLFTWLPAGEPWDKVGLTLGPGRQEAIVAWPCRTGHRQASGGLGRALAALGTGARRCGDWLEFLPVGTCCFPLLLAPAFAKQVQLRKKPRASGLPSCSL